ncbi:hypothetical protein JTE90_000559 [Oedothorax gibbosus]|uniref:Uncharacterized protein n=1 Tax=Oedothorax gibbosus TaxID=931172 RepID=A0AAV6VV03_9ARAC|nr:hypothetical protein JTE90_000559 [Oedothorax gibbosus]
MLRNTSRRFISMISNNGTPRFYSKNKNEARLETMFNEHQGSYYTAKDVEFCPNRAKEVMQNNVEGASENSMNEEPFAEIKKSSVIEEDDHMEAYRADSSVSLYSVMQNYTSFQTMKNFELRRYATTSKHTG